MKAFFGKTNEILITLKYIIKKKKIPEKSIFFNQKWKCFLYSLPNMKNTISVKIVLFQFSCWIKKEKKTVTMVYWQFHSILITDFMFEVESGK